jgi:type II secretory ATPase GspE/PulE/Tfp pilus assembly ATPase PilB-like protein
MRSIPHSRGDSPVAASRDRAPEPGPTATQAVDSLLRRALEVGASDLHIDPEEGRLRVRARRDGVLEPLEDLSSDLAATVIGRLKSLSDLLVYRTDIPQEGRIPADRSPVGLEVRVATFPTLLGERAALRFDAPGSAALDLPALGLPAAALAALRTALEQPSGTILLTGPSGSGKTSTLYAAIRHLATAAGARSLVTIEDPVERRLPGVTQTQVNPAAGLTFARALRSILRQDPEVILVGEIRDRETASIALEAGLTGHLVLSTVHAGTAPGVFARLIDMGVEPFVLTTAVRGVIGQRLVRQRREGVWKGRCLLAEWLPMTPGLRAAVLARGDEESLRAAAVAEGFRDIREEAQDLVRSGATTRDEIERVLGTAGGETTGGGAS